MTKIWRSVIVNKQCGGVAGVEAEEMSVWKFSHTFSGYLEDEQPKPSKVCGSFHILF